MNSLSALDDWHIGGSADPQAHAVMGLTEAEVAQMAVEAYMYASDKTRDAAVGNRGAQFRGCVDLTTEFENLVYSRLGFDQPQSVEDDG